jgi:predicted transposase YdaD
MKESTTYQSILTEGRQEGESMGRVREAPRILRLQGMRRFGAPSPAIEAVLEAIDDVDRLEALSVRIVEPDLQGWDDLLRGS